MAAVLTIAGPQRFVSTPLHETIPLVNTLPQNDRRLPMISDTVTASRPWKGWFGCGSPKGYAQFADFWCSLPPAGRHSLLSHYDHRMLLATAMDPVVSEYAELYLARDQYVGTCWQRLRALPEDALHTTTDTQMLEWLGALPTGPLAYLAVAADGQSAQHLAALGTRISAALKIFPLPETFPVPTAEPVRARPAAAPKQRPSMDTPKPPIAPPPTPLFRLVDDYIRSSFSQLPKKIREAAVRIVRELPFHHLEWSTNNKASSLVNRPGFFRIRLGAHYRLIYLVDGKTRTIHLYFLGTHEEYNTVTSPKHTSTMRQWAGARSV